MGSSTSTFQFSASTGASSGTVNSQADVSVITQFDDMAVLGTSSNVKLSISRARPTFSTELGAFMNAHVTVRTPFISVPLAPDVPSATIDLDLIDKDYFLDTSDTDEMYVFGESLSGKDSVSLPGPGTFTGDTASSSPNVDQTSSLTISSLMGTLRARNSRTGAVLTEAVTMTGGMLDVDLDLRQTGNWTLTLEEIMPVNSFKSDFGPSASFKAALQSVLGVEKLTPTVTMGSCAYLMLAFRQRHQLSISCRSAPSRSTTTKTA